MRCEAPILHARAIGKHYALFDKPSHRLWHMLFPRMRTWCTRQEVLVDVDFVVRRGETVGLVGRNGAGKSTLLGILCGTLEPSSGAVVVNGRVAALLELGAGFNPELTGRENIDLRARLYGLDSARIDAKRDEMIAFADIGDYIDRPVKRYSSGMFMRLAFAVAAHVDAEILIVDEALAVGDAFFVQKCMRHLERFREGGGTLVFVSHDMGAVTALCDRVLWLAEGRIAMDAGPKEVAGAYLAALYGGGQGDSTIVRRPATGAGADHRAALLEDARLRNDIAVAGFVPAHDFGEGGASIVSSAFVGVDGERQSRIVGGECVRLDVQVVAQHAIASLIVGFVVKDKHGQPLFGDNTYLSHRDAPIALSPGDGARATFEFRMPVLPPGHYSISLAVSDGTQRDHRVHQWIHDALLLTSRGDAIATGLIGIPMHRIACVRDDAAAMAAST